VVQHEVRIAKLPEPLNGSRLIILSDLHPGSQPGSVWLAKRVPQLRRLKPGIIVLLGDIFEGHGLPSSARQPILAQFRAPLEVYAVTGRHEFHSNSDAAIAMSKQAGVQWLRNRSKLVAPGLLQAGSDELSHHPGNSHDEDQATPLLSKRPQGATILLSHSPLQVTQAASAGTAPMLSGHTYGGQIWPFSYLVERFYPYLAGRNQMAHRQSRHRLWSPRMRLWYPGEIIEVTLESADKGNI
jgi:predicted MPP superfamily phosphohydrolase